MTVSLPTALAGPVAEACCAPAGLEERRTLDAERIAALAKALGEPVRVRILDVLRRHGQPLCQCELQPLFDIQQSTLSHHVSKLAAAGLVEVDRRHKWAFYSVPEDALEELTAWLR
jgi:ArsR family transcriptional regulator, arsenate/arsenite/antimonite-responsive transcriptional repressor